MRLGMRIGVIAALLAALGSTACERIRPQPVYGSGHAGAAKLFTAYNLWYEQPERLYSINYKKGGLIPAGTEVVNLSITPSRSPLVKFQLAKGSPEFTILFQKKFHPGMAAEQFRDRLFTPKDFSQLTRGFSNTELKAIKSGAPVIGMSKQAVQVGYGLPPEHATFSLDNNTWTYWLDRFRKKIIYFDANGRTTRAPTAASNAL